MTKNLWWNRTQTDDFVLRNDTGEYWRVRVGKMEQLLHNDYIEVLREYFRDERDRELGRWRWPENPDYVVYPHGEDQEVRVVNERTGYVNLTGRPRGFQKPVELMSTKWRIAARAYFDAHPEKKPWHDAKPGEVWELTTTHIPNKVTAWSTFDGVFMDSDQNRVMGADILEARRIWPESKES